MITEQKALEIAKEAGLVFLNKKSKEKFTRALNLAAAMAMEKIADLTCEVTDHNLLAWAEEYRQAAKGEMK